MAYRAALEELKRERVPLDWAKAQNNLGFALWKLGVQESGTTRLEEAIVAYRSALEERTRERVPLDWAQTKMNLGDALQTISDRREETAGLVEAVAAWNSALEITRAAWPTEWIRSVETRRDATKAEVARRLIEDNRISNSTT